MSKDNDLFQLPGLESVDWPSLHHAYGEASGTAEDLRNLASANADMRGYGLSQLGMSIFHQGSLYTSTIAAVPFLVTAAEHLDGTTKADLVSLIAAIGESAAISPGRIADSVYLSWSLRLDAIAQSDPRTIAISEINTSRAVLTSITGLIERFVMLVAEKWPELQQAILDADQLSWSGDFLVYAASLSALSAGVALTVLAEPVSLSYKALANKLDRKALSATALWWALEQELSGDDPVLFADSLARDLNENVRLGWTTGKHYERQTLRLWETWTRRLLDKPEQTAKVKQHLERKAEPGWLPQSREDKLIVEAIEMGFCI